MTCPLPIPCPKGVRLPADSFVMPGMAFNVNNKKVTIYGFIQFNKGELAITFLVYIYKKNNPEYVGKFACPSKTNGTLEEMLQKIQDGKLFSILPMALIIKKIGELFKKKQAQGVNNHLGYFPGEIIVIFIAILYAVSQQIA